MNKAVRHLVTVLGLGIALIAMFLITSSNIAQADGPTGQVHFYRPAQVYDQIAKSPLTDCNCNLSYYGGKVMLSSTTYAIYWGPSGHGISKSYRNLINRYFKDLGGSAFYGMMTQYYQNPGPTYITNSSTFGGSWVDKTAYPRAGDYSHPLTDADLRASIARARAAKGWSGGYGSMFFVFMAKGIESCSDSFDCTIGTAYPAYCAYHSNYSVGGQTIIYASMPYAATWHTGFAYSCDGNQQIGPITKSPNRNLDGDLEISPTSHEQFESVTDANPHGPFNSLTAWVDTSNYENGDKCAYNYGKIAGDGHNITLNGHPYIMQLEWSNSAFKCKTK